MPDPNLQAAMEEIKAVLKKRNACALVFLTSPTHVEYRYHFEATWSCAWLEENGLLRVRAKRQDFSSLEAQSACLSATAGTFLGLKDACQLAIENLDKVMAMLAEHVEIEHYTALESPQAKAAAAHHLGRSLTLRFKRPTELKMKKTKAQLDKEFIEKVKTLGIATGAKPPCPKCPDCGGPLKDAPLLSVGVAVRHRRRNSAPRQDEETSLAE